MLTERSQWENWNHLSCCKVSFTTSAHCPIYCVSRGMQQTSLYLWFPFVQWDRWDQHCQKIHSVKEQYLHSGTGNEWTELAFFSWEIPAWRFCILTKDQVGEKGALLEHICRLSVETNVNKQECIATVKKYLQSWNNVAR